MYEDTIMDTIIDGFVGDEVEVEVANGSEAGVTALGEYGTAKCMVS